MLRWLFIVRRGESNLNKKHTHRYVYFVSLLVQAFVEFATEKLDAHDGENQPEHQAHQQNVEDGRDCVHQSVHHDLENQEQTTHSFSFQY